MSNKVNMSISIHLYIKKWTSLLGHSVYTNPDGLKCVGLRGFI